jgi:hypothetical protein
MNYCKFCIIIIASLLITPISCYYIKSQITLYCRTIHFHMRLNEVEELDEMSQQQLVQTHYPTKYLTNMQWRNINYILGHNNSTPEMKNKVKNVIYNYYEDWAFSRVYYFRQKYWYICYQIQLDELKLYAYIGLRKAIINYDSKKTSDFAKYASKYIYNEIFIGVNELLPIYRAFQFYKNKNKYFTVANKYKKSKPKV